MPEQRRIGYRWKPASPDDKAEPLEDHRTDAAPEIPWHQPLRKPGLQAGHLDAGAHSGKDIRGALRRPGLHPERPFRTFRGDARRGDSEDLGIQPGNPIARRVRLVAPEDGE